MKKKIASDNYKFQNILNLIPVAKTFCFNKICNEICTLENTKEIGH